MRALRVTVATMLTVAGGLMIGVQPASASPFPTTTSVSTIQNPSAAGLPITYVATVYDILTCANPRLPAPRQDAPHGSVTFVDVTTGTTLGTAMLGPPDTVACPLGTDSVPDPAGTQIIHTFPSSRAGHTDQIVATYNPSDVSHWTSSSATLAQQFSGSVLPPPPGPNVVQQVFAFLLALIRSLGL